MECNTNTDIFKRKRDSELCAFYSHNDITKVKTIVYFINSKKNINRMAVPTFLFPLKQDFNSSNFFQLLFFR